MKLNKFLVKAKIATYASNGNEKKLEDGSRELNYSEDTFVYRDRYFGSNPFIGEEVVWENNKPVWCMNYSGKAKNKDVYLFLKKALTLVPEDNPYRGPLQYIEGDWKYVNLVNGTIENFNGTEIIFFKDELVYELHYHGGYVKD
jgi:hypothetical protein